jgi:hypothetical protein
MSTSHPIRSFVLRTPEDAAEMIATLKATAGPAAQAGKPLLVTIAQRVESRSQRSNRYMWAAVLQPAAEQLTLNGHKFSAETLHEYFKRQHLPEVTANGRQKWTILPSGERILAIGTSDLDAKEFAEYIEKCQAEAAGEWGVVFTDQHHREEETA